MLTKEEKILYALHSIKSVLNDLGLEDIKNELRLKDGSVETLDCINVLQEFIVDYVNINQPYKFEDLKEGMWVWDNRIKEFSLIKKILTKEDCMYLYHDENKKVFIDEYSATEFEEGRFYPVTKALCEG
ncbi:hypothetical protein [Thomasclavelia spiroformis]|uniref:hypothetical protein n=1 Tax=Thomasclavelia spiroformis TaxID=29348 RepID=UPI003209391D